MSVATEIRTPVKPIPERRGILGPAGNRVRVSEESKRKKEGPKMPEKTKRLVTGAAPRSNILTDTSSCSSESSCGRSSSVKIASCKRRLKYGNGSKSAAKVFPHAGDGTEIYLSLAPVPLRRCDWITPNSDPIYTSFHDEEWGVPVHDDKKLFELLVCSQALSEHSWASILSKRELFRKLFDNFDPSSVAKCTENMLPFIEKGSKLLSEPKIHAIVENANQLVKQLLPFIEKGSKLLSEPKIHAIVENANQLVKVQREFGSFNNYLWRFVNNKPIRNEFRYCRQVPAKTPKSELISKDLMRRGFRFVGPTVVYLFMQVSGMVNDHLITCFRFNLCSSNNNNLNLEVN